MTSTRGLARDPRKTEAEDSIAATGSSPSPRPPAGGSWLRDPRHLVAIYCCHESHLWQSPGTFWAALVTRDRRG